MKIKQKTFWALAALSFCCPAIAAEDAGPLNMTIPKHRQ